ncbi:MAG: NnrU family protein [Proteobacteria bacterium]|nr:NnrU family protein [Pseudomonadota bacterium]
MALWVLIVCIVVFLAVHLIPMNPSLRAAVAGKIGERPYMAIFSLLSLAGFFGGIVIYRSVDHIALWPSPPEARWVTMVLMFLSFVFFAAAKGAPWINRIVRHPMLWGMGLFGAAHLISNGEVPGVVLFGGLALFGFGWQILTDRRDAVADPEAWAEIQRTTSNIPFAKWSALGDGAPRVTLCPLLAGLVLFALFVWFHPTLFGMPVIQP